MNCIKLSSVNILQGGIKHFTNTVFLTNFTNILKQMAYFHSLSATDGNG